MLKPLVAVVVGLVGTVDGNVEVLRLHLGELGELHIQLREVSAGDLLVERLGQHVHLATLELVFLVVPQRDLGERLVAERGAHDERGVARSTAQVHETTLGQQDYVAAVGERVAAVSYTHLTLPTNREV